MRKAIRIVSKGIHHFWATRVFHNENLPESGRKSDNFSRNFVQGCLLQAWWRINEFYQAWTWNPYNIVKKYLFSINEEKVAPTLIHEGHYTTFTGLVNQVLFLYISSISCLHIAWGVMANTWKLFWKFFHNLRNKTNMMKCRFTTILNKSSEIANCNFWNSLCKYLLIINTYTFWFWCPWDKRVYHIKSKSVSYWLKKVLVQRHLLFMYKYYTYM